MIDPSRAPGSHAVFIADDDCDAEETARFCSGSSAGCCCRARPVGSVWARCMEESAYLVCLSTYPIRRTLALTPPSVPQKSTGLRDTRCVEDRDKLNRGKLQISPAVTRLENSSRNAVCLIVVPIGF